MGQHHCGGVGAVDSDTLAFQGRDDLGRPGGVASAPVLLEPGVNPRLARSLQLCRGGQAAMTSKTASCCSQGPDSRGLVDHHQQASVAGRLVVENTQARLVVGQGFIQDLPPLPAKGRDPVLALCRRPVPMKTSTSSIPISPAASRCTGAGPAIGRPVPHPRLRKTSHTAGRSTYQRSPACGCRG